MSTEKIYVGIEKDKVELTGAEKEAFIADRDARAQARLLLETQYEAKKQARIDAITKLGLASGLTTAEITAILDIL